MNWKRAGAAIRRDRARIYGTREEFAAASGVSVSVLSDLERGARTNFDADTLGRVEDALGWAPCTIEAVADGGRIRRTDPDLARLQQVWPRLPRQVRALLADVAEAADERGLR